MSKNSATLPLISLVVPIYNEEEGIEALFRSLQETCRRLPAYRWELVLVDDGSSDRSVETIKELRGLLDIPLRLVRLSRNFGHQPALAAGISRARGEALICLDADLQDPPDLLPAFLEKFHAGYDVVFGVRAKREAGWFRELPYKTFYRIYRRLSNFPVAVDSGDFALISSRVARLMSDASESDLFLRGFRSWVGFRQIGIPYDRPARAHGQTKYTLGKLLRLAASAFFGYSHVPLRLSTGLGLGTVLVSLLYFIFIIVRRFSGVEQPSGWASLMGVILLVGGMQLITIGILGEYVGRIYQQTQARPIFVISEDEEL